MLNFGLTSICQNVTPREGLINVEGGRIWYKIVGEGHGIPLLIIHGGPGSRSCNSIPGYSVLGDERPIIFYDQLGSGNSDRPSDTTLWQLPRFVDEIEKLRNVLRLGELHILGASWGASILIEYMVTKNPKGVKSIIFKSPLLSTPVWMNDAKILLSQLPPNLQDTIKKYEALKDYFAPAYLAATDSFNNRFLSIRQGPEIPNPECDSVLGFNDDIYNYMWGPTEFNATGTLKNFDRTADLHKINQPILFLAGQFDEARPETIYKFKELAPNSKVVIIENSGHICILDQPEQTIKEIRIFLHSVELK
jgi:proline iminopeptidase